MVSWRARALRVLGVIAVPLSVVGCASGVSGEQHETWGTASSLRSRVVAGALKNVGAPYARGGTSPAGFDCSGLVMYVYARAGRALPHSAVKQYELGSPVARDDLEPGDIVFFDHLRHSGIYIGGGKFVHASKPGDVVKISNIREEWFRRRWVGARRLH
jgi:cell wall-associated NlpC family hydrolase